MSLNNILKNKSLLAFIFICFIPILAQAHMYGSNANGFLSGFLHPISGLDHFLAMFSVGLWGAQIGGRSVWTLPVTFPLVMVIGGILGILGVYIPAIEIGIAISIIVLGLAITLNWKTSQWIVLTLISIFAIFHGHAHGTELPNAVDPSDFAIGFVIATGLIHILGIAVGMVCLKQFSNKVVSGLGALIILGGIYFFIMAI